MATLVAPTKAYRYRGKKSKWHLKKAAPTGENTQRLIGNEALSVCGIILWRGQIDTANVSELQPNEICVRCCGALEVRP